MGMGVANPQPYTTTSSAHGCTLAVGNVGSHYFLSPQDSLSRSLFRQGRSLTRATTRTLVNTLPWRLGAGLHPARTRCSRSNLSRKTQPGGKLEAFPIPYRT